MTDKAKAAAAYRKLAEAAYELADLYTEAAGGAADDLPPLLREQPLPDVAQQHAETVLGRCPDHDLPWRGVAGGISKRTGNPYKAFWTCQVKECKKRPVKAWEDAHPAAAAA